MTDNKQGSGNGTREESEAACSRQGLKRPALDDEPLMLPPANGDGGVAASTSEALAKEAVAATSKNLPAPTEESATLIASVASNENTLSSKPNEPKTLEHYKVENSGPDGAATSKPMEAATSKAMESATSKPMESATSKPMEAATSKPDEATTSSSTEAMNSKADEVATLKLTEAANSKPGVAATSTPDGAAATSKPTGAETSKPDAATTSKASFFSEATTSKTSGATERVINNNNSNNKNGVNEEPPRPSGSDDVTVPPSLSALKKATTCPTNLSAAASAAAVAATGVMPPRSAGPPPVKVRRKEPPPSQAKQPDAAASAEESAAAAAAAAPPRNYSFLAGELDYFIVCGLPLVATDASLKRTFKGLFKKSLNELSQVIVVPEIDSKTVLLFPGGGTTTARVSKPLTVKRLQKKLQSGLFVSRFPEDANLASMRAYASDSAEYLYKWTRLYFCPVSPQVAEDIQCQHFLVSNLSQSLLRSPSDLLIKFSQTMPTARSFFLPVDEAEAPLGYMLVRFNKSDDCLSCYRLLQKHYSMEMSFVSLLELCQLPGGFSVPAHNLLNWCRLERGGASAAGGGGGGAFAQPSAPRVVLDDPVRSPYQCTCHPGAQWVAPPPERLHQVADELETVAAGAAAAPTTVDFKSLLLKLC